MAVLNAWGACSTNDACWADVNGDWTVDLQDIVRILVLWGPKEPCQQLSVFENLTAVSPGVANVSLSLVNSTDSFLFWWSNKAPPNSNTATISPGTIVKVLNSVSTCLIDRTYMCDPNNSNVLGPCPVISVAPESEMIVLSNVGDAWKISAEVLPTVKLRYISSDPSVVSVSSSGVVAVQRKIVSTVAIVVSAPQATSVTVFVSIADLTNASSFLASASVASYDVGQGILTLILNESTRSLMPGAVVVVLDYGILRLLSLNSNGDNSFLSFVVEPGYLTDVFVNLSLMLTRSFDSGTNTLTARTSSIEGECKVSGSLGSVSVVLPSISLKTSLSVEYNLVIEASQLKRLEIYLDGSCQFSAAEYVLELSAAASLSGSCKLEMPSITIPIPSTLLTLDAVLTPSFSLTVSGSLSAGKVTLTGPSAEYGVKLKAGLSYDASSGAGVIFSADKTGQGLIQRPQPSITEIGETTLKAEGSAAMTLSLRFLKSVDFDVLSSSFGIGIQSSIAYPTSVDALGYKGPRSSSYSFSRLTFDPKIELGTFLKIFQLKPFEFDISPWKGSTEFIVEFWKTAVPTLSLSPTDVPIGDQVTFTSSAQWPKDGLAVEFVLFKDGSTSDPPKWIGDGVTDSTGLAQIEWQPQEPDDEGKWQALVRVDDPNSIFNFLPVAPDAAIPLQVSGNLFSGHYQGDWVSAERPDKDFGTWVACVDNGGSLALTVFAPALTMTGTGTVANDGKTAFSSSGTISGIQVSVSFEGSYSKSSTGQVSGSGTYSGTSGQGSWTGRRIDTNKC